jgi:hypothetical protein
VGVEEGAGLVEVVVADGDLAGAHAAAEAERVDVLAVLHGVARGRGEPQRGVAGDRRVHGGVVAHDPHVAVLGVREEPEDAVLLEQAADECEVGLAVLHAVVARGVARMQGEAVFVAGEAGLVEHLADDLPRWSCSGRYDCSRGAAGGGPGGDRQLVELELAAVADVLGLDDDPVDVPRLVEALDREQRGPVDQVVGIEVCADDLDAELEQLAQGLVPGEAEDA